MQVTSLNFVNVVDPELKYHLGEHRLVVYMGLLVDNATLDLRVLRTALSILDRISQSRGVVADSVFRSVSVCHGRLVGGAH